MYIDISNCRQYAEYCQISLKGTPSCSEQSVVQANYPSCQRNNNSYPFYNSSDYPNQLYADPKIPLYNTWPGATVEYYPEDSDQLITKDAFIFSSVTNVAPASDTSFQLTPDIGNATDNVFGPLGTYGTGGGESITMPDATGRTWTGAQMNGASKAFQFFESETDNSFIGKDLSQLVILYALLNVLLV